MSYSDYTHWRDTPLATDPDLSVVIPAYNEAERIVPTIAAISAHLAATGLDFDIIVSDDGSTDDTVSLVRALGLANVRVIDPGVNAGKGAAVRAGMQEASGRHVLFTDADMSTPIGEIDRFLAAAADGADIVIGSRAADGAEEAERSLLRRTLSGGLRRIVKVALGLDIEDPQCGFKMFSAAAAEAIFGLQRIDGFSFDAELLFLAKRLDLQVAELPVSWTDAPGSKVSPIRTSLCFLFDLLRIRVRAARGTYRTPTAATGRPSVALVTAYPPSKTTLNEYGFHLANELIASPEFGRVSVLADDVDDLPDHISGASIRPAWRFNSMTNPLRILRAVRAEQPDVVMFNMHFTSFGGSRVAAALGLCTPALLRLFGHKTVVVLHNLVDTVDLETAGYASNPLTKRALTAVGRLLTRVVLLAHQVGVTVPTYVEILEGSYGATNVYLAPHGTFGGPRALPEERQGRQIMTFGKFGTYKRVDLLIEAFRHLTAKPGFDDVELVIAGSDSPTTPGYLDHMAAEAADLDHVTFTGYVAEEDVEDLFLDASLVVFPYTGTTGSSGPLHQAGAYGRAAVLPELGDFVDLIEAEGFRGEQFHPTCASSLATAVERLLVDDDRRNEIRITNFEAATALPLAAVVELHATRVQQLVRAAG